jgi:hypothetical protein
VFADLFDISMVGVKSQWLEPACGAAMSPTLVKRWRGPFAGMTVATSVRHSLLARLRPIGDV